MKLKKVNSLKLWMMYLKEIKLKDIELKRLVTQFYLGVLLNLKNQLATIFKMSNSGISTKGVIQIILVLGAIYLASVGDGCYLYSS
jgi:hypothetical protein